MKKFSKAGYTALLLSCILPLAACGSEEKSGTVANGKLDKEHVFSQKDMTEIMDQIEISDIESICIEDGYLYMMGSYYGEGYSANNRFGSIKLDGTDAKVFQVSEDDIYYYDDEELEDEELPAELEEEGFSEDELEKPHGEDAEVAFEEDMVTQEAQNEEEQVEEEQVSEDEVASEEEIAVEDYYYDDFEDGYEYSYTNYLGMAVYNGNFILLKEDYSETYENDEFQSTEQYSVVSYDRDGNLLNEYQMPDTEEEYTYIEYFQVTKDGNIFFVLNENEIVELDASFQLINSHKVEDISYVYDLYIVGDTVIYRGWDADYENQHVYRLNMKTNETESFDVPAIASSGTVYQGNDEVDLYIATEKEIYAWNVEKGEVVEVLDFIDSDVDISYVEAFCPLSATDFIILYCDTENYERCISEFVKVDPEKVVDKKVITLACEYLDYNVKSQIIAFNKENESYRIQVNDYSIYDTYDDYNAGLTKLNNDIAAGKIPDIMLLSGNMPIASYNEKGLFADLKEFVDKDSDFSMDDFAPNIVKAYSYDGKWYTLVPDFSIVTYGVKQSLADGKENWTVDDALKLWEQYPDAMLIEDGTKDSILYEGLSFMGNQFVDWKTGNCKFNTDEFIALLEFANKFPEDCEHSDDYWNEYYTMYETMYRENKALCMYMYISSISAMNYREQGMMGENMTFVGFPTENGSGASISADLMISITSKSKEKDGAWEFVKSYISEEYDTKNVLSIRMDKLEEQVERATQRPHYTEEDGTEVEYDDYYYIGDKEILIEPMSKERATEILNYILSIETTSFYDEDLVTLISEEAESFFSGQKSAKEVADIIQSRAQIYVNEHM